MVEVSNKLRRSWLFLCVCRGTSRRAETMLAFSQLWDEPSKRA